MARKKSIIVSGEKVVVQEEQILKFQQEIENLVTEGDMTYIEAIAHYCQLCDVEIESVTNLISVSLMEKIHHEAKELRLIKTTSTSLFDSE